MTIHSNMKKNMGGGAAVALVAVGWLGREAVGFREGVKQEKAPEPIAVAVTVATNAVFNPSAEYVGHVEPTEVTDILPQIDGYVKRVCFTEGAKVERGDLLFEIDEEQYLAAKNLRSSEVASAEAKVVVAKAEVDRAERYFQRLGSVSERSVSALERDNAETALASAKAALNAIKPVLEGIGNWTEAELHDRVMEAIPGLGMKNGQVLWPMRIAISGQMSTPGGAFEIAYLLGREETLRRLNQAIAALE